MKGFSRFALLFLIVLAAWAGFFLWAALFGGPQVPEPSREPLRVYGPIEAFHLLDQDGRPFRREDLLGKVWVVDFFFTRCHTLCPQLTLKMDHLARGWHRESRLEFLSVSVDPEFDRPEILRSYAQAHDIPLSRWTLATGEKKAILDLSQKTFKLGMGTERGADGDITHSSRFVLVDAKGRIRGYYNALDDAGLKGLDRDLNALFHKMDAP
ncbi:MAG: SCO family protein [Planctomycetota bacterium]